MERTEEPHVLSRKERNRLCEYSLWVGNNSHHDEWRHVYHTGQASIANEMNVLLLALKAVLNDPKDDGTNRWIIINMMSDLCASHALQQEQRQIDRLSDNALQVGLFEKRQSSWASSEPASAAKKAIQSAVLRAKGSGTELDQKKN